jgi:beta-phosphoglucomutase
MTLHGLIFDMDGVIADTHAYHFRAWKRLADEENVPFSEADNEVIRGLSREASVQYMTRSRPLESAEMQAWMERKNRYFHECLTQLQPIPGVVAFVDAAEKAGLALAVGSASRNARLVLEALGLLHRFAVVGDALTIVNTKPAPDIYLWVAGALRLKPTEVLVIEDSAAGVEAAKRGGFRVLGLGSAAHGADVMLPSLEGVTLTEVLRRFGED